MTSGDELTIVDASLRYKLKSMQYVGPVLMGFGTFLLIIACVITLESRDRHAQIIQEESSSFRRAQELANSATKSSLLPADEVQRNHNDKGRAQPGPPQAVPGPTDRPEVDSAPEEEERREATARWVPLTLPNPYDRQAHPEHQGRGARPARGAARAQSAACA